MSYTPSNTQTRAGWICSTIGQKQVIGLTGLGLCGFVLMHMAGNMLILVGPQAYNEYSHALISNPLIYAAEAGLVVMFLAHLAIASIMSVANWRARDSSYAVSPHGDKGTSLIKRTLWFQGLLILVFVILHLITFKYGTHYTADYGKGEVRDLHKLIIDVFHQPLYVVWYTVALVTLLFHLSHGLASSLQTFGLYHPRFQCGIKIAGWAYALVVGLGFIVQPLYVFFIYKG